MTEKGTTVDPLSFSHSVNPMCIEKTICGLDINSTLEIKEAGASCNVCNAVSTAEPDPALIEPNPADREPDPAASEPDPNAEPEPEKRDHIHWACGIGMPACLDTEAQAMTSDESKVTCEKCRDMIKAVEAMKKPSGDGLNIVFVNIPADTISNVFANLLSGISVK
jgi:hypothetical protein